MSWIEIFRTGTWTDSAGRTRTWTRADLDRIVRTYDPSKREAPLVFGHPKDNAPAYGWVEKLRVSGESLCAWFKQVPDAVKELIAQGRYKKRSISLYPDGTLRHVGLLGAVPPAVPGLKDIGAFGSDDNFIEYQEESTMDPVELLKKQNAELQAEIERLKAQQKGSEFSEQIKGLEGKLKDLEGRLAAATAEKEKVEKEFAESKAAARAKEIEAKVDQLIEKGKALPAEKKQILEFARVMDGEKQEIDFSDGKGRKPCVDHFFEFLDSRGEHGLFSSFAEPKEGGDKGGSVDYGKIMERV